MLIDKVEDSSRWLSPSLEECLLLEADNLSKRQGSFVSDCEALHLSDSDSASGLLMLGAIYADVCLDFDLSHNLLPPRVE